MKSETEFGGLERDARETTSAAGDTDKRKGRSPADREKAPKAAPISWKVQLMGWQQWLLEG